MMLSVIDTPAVSTALLVMLATGAVGFVIRGLRGLLKRQMALVRAWFARAEESFVKVAAVDRTLNVNEPGTAKRWMLDKDEQIEQLQTDVSVTRALRVADLDHSAIPTLTFCSKLEVVQVNESALREFGVKSKTDMVGHNWKDRVISPTIERLNQLLETAAREKRPLTLDVIVRTSQTNGRSIQITMHPVIGCVNQEFIGFAGRIVPLEPLVEQSREMLEQAHT